LEKLDFICKFIFLFFTVWFSKTFVINIESGIDFTFKFACTNAKDGLNECIHIQLS